jgi:iron complex outermembrane receptor protein
MATDFKRRLAQLTATTTAIATVLATPALMAAEDDDDGHAHGGAVLHQPLEEMVVTATPLNSAVTDITQGVTVLEGDELSRLVSNTIGETLAMQPGVTASFFGAGSSRPIIRGLGGARVRVMDDGISSLDVSTVSVDHAVALEPLLVERVEVLRGPTTLLYGSGAVGGIVNTVTTRLPETLPEKAIDGRFEVRGDTVADERTGAFGIDGRAGRFVLHLDGVAREASDYRIPGSAEVDPEEGEEAESGRLENSSLEAQSVAAGLGWIGDNTFVSVGVTRFETNYGVPGAHEEGEGGEEEEEEEEIIRIDMEQTRVDLKAGWSGTGAIRSVRFRGAYNDYEHVELEGEEIGTQFANDAFEGRLELTHAPLGAWEGAFGLQFDVREFSAIGDEAFVPPVDSTSLGAFIVEEGTFGDWRASLGARVEGQSQEPTGGESVDDTAYSLSAGAVRFFDKGNSVALNLSLAQRLPSAEELFSDGPHLATQTFEIGDPTLNVETSQHIELGWRHQSERFSASVAGFYTRFNDFIYLAPTGEIEDGLPVFLWTQADAEFAGLEAEFGARVAEIGRGEVDVRLFGDIVSGELVDGGNLPQISPARLGARIEYHGDRIAAGIDSNFVFEQDNVAQFETPTDGYTMLNADFSWSFPVGDSANVDLFLRATNLLDEDARRHTSFVKDFAPLPGRNLAFGVRGRF